MKHRNYNLLIAIVVGCLIVFLAAYFLVVFLEHLATDTYTKLGVASQTRKLSGPADIYPDPALTPGATNASISQANIRSTICSSSWSTKTIRPPVNYTTGLKLIQLGLTNKNISGATITIDVYGSYNSYKNENPAAYEEDHLISLELGGSPTDIRNLWPEPYTTSISSGGARSKDSVENYLHSQICHGKISLAEAQKEIVTDWYAVYIKMNNNTSLGAISNIDQDDQ